MINVGRARLETAALRFDDEAAPQLQPQHGHDIGAGEFAGDFAFALCLEIGTFFATTEAAAFLHLDWSARRGQGLQTRMQFTPTPLPAFAGGTDLIHGVGCLLYTSPSPRDATLSRMPSSA